MAGAGDRSVKITLQRSTPAFDNAGVEIDSWATLGSAWASVRYGTGTERRQLGQEGAAIVASFRLLAFATARGLTPRDRLVDGLGRVWNITSVAPTPDRQHIDVTALLRQD